MIQTYLAKRLADVKVINIAPNACPEYDYGTELEFPSSSLTKRTSYNGNT